MFEQLRKIFDPALRGTDPAHRAAVEQVVDGTDPRFRMVAGYRRRLAVPLTHALGHIETLAARLPEARPVEPGRYGHDLRLRALLGSPERLRAVFAASRSLHAFLGHPRNAAARECLALLVCGWRRRTVMGHGFQGGTVQQDVLREVVEFPDPQVVVPAADDAALRQKVKERLLDDLLAHALMEVTSLRGKDARLDERRRLLAAKARTLTGTERFGLSGELAGGDRRQQLEGLEGELAALHADPITVAEYLDLVCGVLEGAPASLRLEPVGFGYDGVHTVPGPRDEAGFTLHEVRYGKGRPLLVLPVQLTPPLIDRLRRGAG